MPDFVKKLLLYFLAALSLVSISSGFVYKIYKLDFFGVVASLCLAAISFIIVLFLEKKIKTNSVNLLKNNQKLILQNYFKDKSNFKPLNLIILVLYLCSAVFSIYLMIKNSTTEPLISPWQVLHWPFFTSFIAATVLLFINIFKNTKLSFFLVIIHYFLSFSLAVFVYKLGFGFDPFIHNATMDYISLHGQALPKPFYYLGYYGLIVITHKLTLIPIAPLDKFIVPALSAIYLPFAAYQVGRKWFSDKKKILLSIILFLILPFGFFIISTPQNLAFLFLLLVIMFGLTCSDHFDLIMIYVLSLAAISYQPIAGLPALFLAIGLTIYHSGLKKFKKLAFLLLFVLNAIALPMAFHVVNNFDGQAGAENPAVSSSQAIKNFFSISFAGSENALLNFIYFYIFNIHWLIFLLAAAGLIIAVKYRKECKITFLYLSLSLSLFLSFFLAKSLSFSYLIDYEQNNFTDRILSAAIFFLLPFVFISFHAFFTKLEAQTKIFKLIIIISLALLLTASLYGSYPRKDNYFDSHGYAVSEHDVAAANWIDGDAQGDYVVLANQQVSAAALSQYGFKKYYTISPLSGLGEGQGVREIFYYPIPTGGNLYQMYLDMVYTKPARATMLKAMDLTGANTSYFVLNKYWWASTKILSEAKLEADSFQEINNGEIFIFKFTR